MTRTENTGSKGPSPLQRSVTDCDFAKVRALLEMGEDPNQRDPRFEHTPLSSLMLAPRSKQNASKIAELLLEYGADIEAVGHGNKTPLYLAVEFGWIEWVEWLLEHGANPDLKIPGKLTPMEYAKFRRSSEMVKLISDILERRALAEEISAVPSRKSPRGRL